MSISSVPLFPSPPPVLGRPDAATVDRQAIGDLLHQFARTILGDNPIASTVVGGLLKRLPPAYLAALVRKIDLVDCMLQFTTELTTLKCSPYLIFSDKAQGEDYFDRAFTNLGHAIRLAIGFPVRGYLAFLPAA